MASKTGVGGGICVSGECALVEWCFASLRCSVLQCVAVCFNVLQCVAVCCSVLLCVVVCCSLQECALVEWCFASLRCSVLQCVAVCCNVLQCVAMCCSVLQCVVDYKNVPYLNGASSRLFSCVEFKFSGSGFRVQV